MKKILTFIIIFISILVIDVDALEYYTINITSSFQESIEFSDVPLIKLTFYSESNDFEDDGAIIRNIVELNESNNYSYVLNETYVNDQTKIFAMVDKDNLGKYNCELEFIPNNNGIAQINIMVTRNNFNREDIEIPKKVLESIYGKNTNNTTNNNSSNSSTSNVGNNTNSTSSTTTTIRADNNTITEQEKEEKKRQEEASVKKNNRISIILFTILGLILLLGIVFVAIKFVKANK